MRYMLAIIGEEGGWEDVTPEQMKEAMSRWAAFDEKVIGDGVWVAGDGLQPSATATTVKIGEGEATVTDGPFAETKEQLGGFCLIDCEGPEEAMAWARKVPLGPGGAIEVRAVKDLTPYGYRDVGVGTFQAKA